MEEKAKGKDKVKEEEGKATKAGATHVEKSDTYGRNARKARANAAMAEDGCIRWPKNTKRKHGRRR